MLQPRPYKLIERPRGMGNIQNLKQIQARQADDKERLKDINSI